MYEFSLFYCSPILYCSPLRFKKWFCPHAPFPPQTCLSVGFPGYSRHPCCQLNMLYDSSSPFPLISILVLLPQAQSITPYSSLVSRKFSVLGAKIGCDPGAPPSICSNLFPHCVSYVRSPPRLFPIGFLSTPPYVTSPIDNLVAPAPGGTLAGVFSLFFFPEFASWKSCEV